MLILTCAGFVWCGVAVLGLGACGLGMVGLDCVLGLWGVCLACC